MAAGEGGEFGCAGLGDGQGAWASLKNGRGNLAATGLGQLAAIIKNRLKSIHCRPALINGSLAQTGLTLEPEPPSTSAFQPL
jgi:putative transposase